GARPATGAAMIPAAPVVVEASVAVKWVISEALTPEPDALLADHLGRSLLVPPHFSGEVTNALYRRVHRSTNPITPAESRAALQTFLGFAIQTLEPPDLYQLAYDLAETHGIPQIYDCLYVGLA